MDSSTSIAIITAFATLIGAMSPIIVALIQSNKEKQKTDNGILLPKDVVLHRPRTQIRWSIILSFAVFGGVIGYGGAKIASNNFPNVTPTSVAVNPTASESPEPIFTISLPSETPNVTPTSEIIPTFSNTPEPLPTPDVHLGIENGCIDSRFWIPFDGKNIKTDNNGCLKLSDWGFFAQDKKLYILPSKNPEGQSHRLYTLLSGNADITFNFQIDKFQTGTRQAYIRFGLATKNFNNAQYLAYHYLPTYPNNVYPKLWANGSYGDPFSINLKMGNIQRVQISIRGNFITIALDGKVVVEKMLLRFESNQFSIEYFLPPSSELSAFISEFTIEEK